jgi:hypothetical protein
MRQGFNSTAQPASQGQRLPVRFSFAASLAALSLAAGASPAGASVTIGQTAPTITSCVAVRDFLQPTVTSGNTYVVPALPPASALVITSWSTQANAGGGMLAMKVYRPLGGTMYMAVGHDGPRPLTGGALNTFPASVAVKAGDVLGNSVPPAAGAPGCGFDVFGETFLFGIGNLPDGASGDFESTTNARINVSAVVSPSNTFALGKVKRNQDKGTATLTVSVPNPGELVLAGKGVKRASAAGAVVAKTVTAPGDVKLKIRAKGKKKRKLNETGKVKVKPTITYTPTSGDPNTQSRRLKLKKAL